MLFLKYNIWENGWHWNHLKYSKYQKNNKMTRFNIIIMHLHTHMKSAQAVLVYFSKNVENMVIISLIFLLYALASRPYLSLTPLWSTLNLGASTCKRCSEISFHFRPLWTVPRFVPRPHVNSFHFVRSFATCSICVHKVKPSLHHSLSTVRHQAFLYRSFLAKRF